MGSLLFGVSTFAQTNEKADELHKAIGDKNTELVKKIIEEDITVLNSPNPRGSTPLAVATYTGQTELVAFMVKKGADVNKANDYGNSPLHYAATNGDFKSFKNLFENGANINSINMNGQTPLQYSW